MVVIGVIGKPNVGKSTFFKAVTLLPVKIADYPFTTLEPYKGQGYLVIECIERRFNVKCNPRSGVCRNGYRYVPIEMIDVPGLVKEAYKGKGLGNKFLDAIRNADILINIVDIAGSTDENGNMVTPGSYNPLEDFYWIEEEVDLWFFKKVKSNLNKVKRKIKEEPEKIFDHFYSIVSGFKIKREDIFVALRKIEKPLSEILESEELLYKFLKILRSVSKPIIHAANKVDLHYGKMFYNKAVKEYPDKIIVPTSAYIELGLRVLDMEGKIEYIPGTNDIIIKSNDPYVRTFIEYAEESVLKEFKTTGVQTILNIAIFNVLGYIAIWPVAREDLKDTKGRTLPDVYLLPPGTTVKDLAERIHSDLLKDMIKAKEITTGKFLNKEDKLGHNYVINILTKK